MTVIFSQLMITKLSRRMTVQTKTVRFDLVIFRGITYEYRNKSPESVRIDLSSIFAQHIILVNTARDPFIHITHQIKSDETMVLCFQRK
jgi:hypothetical protein